jgi:hypothetical protein
MDKNVTKTKVGILLALVIGLQFVLFSNYSSVLLGKYVSNPTTIKFLQYGLFGAIAGLVFYFFIWKN